MKFKVGDKFVFNDNKVNRQAFGTSRYITIGKIYEVVDPCDDNDLCFKDNDGDNLDMGVFSSNYKLTKIK